MRDLVSVAEILFFNEPFYWWILFYDTQIMEPFWSLPSLQLPEIDKTVVAFFGKISHYASSQSLKMMHLQHKAWHFRSFYKSLNLFENGSSLLFDVRCCSRKMKIIVLFLNENFVKFEMLLQIEKSIWLLLLLKWSVKDFEISCKPYFSKICHLWLVPKNNKRYLYEYFFPKWGSIDMPRYISNTII